LCSGDRYKGAENNGFDDERYVSVQNKDLRKGFGDSFAVPGDFKVRKVGFLIFLIGAPIVVLWMEVDSAVRVCGLNRVCT
jgi:hypothetical protein